MVNKMKGPRSIDTAELSDMLQVMQRKGVAVPGLVQSSWSPEYLYTSKGVAVYQHGHKLVEVREGFVIDNHGNVVNLAFLNRQKTVMDLKPTRPELTDAQKANLLFIGRDGRDYDSWRGKEEGDKILAASHARTPKPRYD
jgi:hypothetical protein